MDTAEKAVEIWDTLTPSEKMGVSFGMFPRAKIQPALDQGYEQNALVTNLMRIASTVKRHYEGEVLAKKYVSSN